MTMRAPVADLPIVLEEVSFASGGVTILDRVSLAFAAGAPAVLIGPRCCACSWAWLHPCADA